MKSFSRIALLIGQAIIFQADSAGAADLPIREVVLYKHGVGYFSRAGELRAGEAGRLDFKSTEMNDVLKSLTLADGSGGKVVGLRYDSSEPLERKLAEFPFHLDGQQSLSAFLDQIKGARLEIKFGSETIAGIIVGARITPAEEKHAEREQVILLLDSGELRSFDLSAALSIRFTDPQLQLQLKDYLTAVTQARSKEKRSVYIDSSDTKSRQVVASYIVPTAIWKSTYRLIFGERPEPTLEGWAVIDNTTGEDWNKVRLAVVSGRPISFVSRLYEPRYSQRPIGELAEDRGQAPVVYEGEVSAPSGVAGGAPGSPPSPLPPNTRAMRQQSFSTSGSMADAAQLSERPEFQRKEMSSSIAANAVGRDLGDLFEYRFASPVTVKKSESAMLPFLQQALSARRLLIYTEAVNQKYPLNAAEITNSTGKTLDGGPITVYDANAYAGESLMETLKTGDKRLISYAVDLGTRVTTNFESGRDLIREIHLKRGTLITRSAAEETKTYTIRNVDQKPKTLFIEHPARQDYKLLNQKALETTSNAYRFELKLGPGAVEKFPVREERLYESSTVIGNLSPDVLLSYTQNKSLGEAGRRQLEQILTLKRQIAQTDSELRRAALDVTEMVRDQDRIRQNINSLNQVSGQQEQVQKYSRQLATQEAQLASLRDRVNELQNKKAALEADLNAKIEKMDF